MSPISPEEYLDRLRALLPAVKDRVARAEQLRRLPEETFAEFEEAGLFRAIQPKRWGGFELDPVAFYQAIIETSEVCASTGWVLGVLGVHNWHLALFAPQAQADVWGEDTGVLLCTSLAPTGTVERVAGGFRLSGRWSFSSGCDYCGWAALGGVAPAADGAPADARVFLLPRKDYAIDDNWHVVGLCGTGSKDIVVEEAIVPEYRTHSYLDAFHLRNPGTALHAGPLYRIPFGAMFPNSIASPAIGVARGALNLFRQQAQARMSLRDGTRIAEDPAMQMRLAESAAEIDGAYERIRGNFREMYRHACAGEPIPLERRARYRWDFANAVEWSLRAVNRLMAASGGRGIFLANPIQRTWRDVHAIHAHAGNNPDRAAAVFGRSEFGLPPTDIRF
jgi:3-hydroxy-9,10-secoandrosta-1,3,5(10)-triene-9,17-dione monooxygenase